MSTDTFFKYQYVSYRIQIINMSRVIILRTSNQSIVNYSYLVVDPYNDKSVIIDPAWQMDKIDQAIINSHTMLSGILITHSHPDHIHSARPLAKKYNCPIWMSNEEIEDSGFFAKQLNGIDRTSWHVGKMFIQPLLTPGHSPGSVCYLIDDNLFTGDTLFYEGCGLCSDIQAAYAMYESFENLKAQIKPQCRIFPGHMYSEEPGQMFSEVLKNNIYLKFTDKEAFAAFRLRKNQDIPKLFSFN